MVIFDTYIKCKDSNAAKVLYDEITKIFWDKIINELTNWSDNFSLDSKQANVQFQDSTKKLLVDVFKFNHSAIFPVDGIVQIEYGDDKVIANPYLKIAS